VKVYNKNTKQVHKIIHFLILFFLNTIIEVFRLQLALFVSLLSIKDKKIWENISQFKVKAKLKSLLILSTNNLKWNKK
jgi:hypothetical protein